MNARLVVLVSGAGTNLQALLDACADPGYGASVVAVGADRDSIAALDRAKAADIPTFTVKVRDFPEPAMTGMRRSPTRASGTGPDLIVCAGFMKLVGRAFLARFSGRCLNTHPALLPSFPGMHGVRGRPRLRRQGVRLHRLPRRRGRGRRPGARPGGGAGAR